MVESCKGNDIEGTSMTSLAVDSSANDAPVTDGHGHKCQTARIILITLGALLILIGVWLSGLSLFASVMHDGLVRILVSRDGIGPEKLAKFRYTSWREPSQNIRPFVQGPKSFEGCKILRYRRGTRFGLLCRLTYHEAEYLMPDGRVVVGPAFGPRHYVAPNLFALGPLIIGGVIMVIVGIALRTDKLTEPESASGHPSPDCA
jgi:hypothetical protein